MRRSLVNITVISMLLCGNFSFAMLVGEPDNMSRTLSTANTVSIHETDYKTWFKAARAGDLEEIKSLIDRNIDINRVGKYGKTALDCAARGGHIKVVRVLLEKGRDFFSEEALSRALGNAVRGGRINIVELLLESGINPSSDMLSNAAEKGYAEIVRLLLEKRKDFFSGEALSRALDNAVQGRRTNIVELLLESGINPSSDMLSNASENGYTEIVRLLLEKRKDFFSEKALSRALDSAAKEGYVGLVELFLKNGIEPTSSNVIVSLLKGDSVDKKELSNALNNAALAGNIEVFKFLLDKRADLFFKSVPSYALSNAACRGHTEIVEFLLNKCPDLFDKSTLSNTLYNPVRNGYKKIVRLLLDKGAKPSDCTLEVAVEEKQTEIVRLFLKNSGDLFKKDVLSRALSKAVRYGHKEIVELFLDHGNVDPNFQYMVITNISKDGPPILRSEMTDSMLISAIEKGYVDIAKLLLNKCSVLFDNIVLTKALNYAAERGYTEIIRLLLDKGANPNSESYHLEVAAEKGYTEIIRLLLKKNARLSRYVLDNAVRSRRINIVELLFDKWGGSDYFDKEVLSYALFNTVKRGDTEMVKLLLDNVADPNRISPCVFSEVVQSGIPEIVRLFLERGVNLDFDEG